MKKRYYRLLTPLFVLMALLMVACSSDSEVTTDQQHLCQKAWAASVSPSAPQRIIQT